LAPAALHILVAVADEDRHGYGIMQEIARQSQGQYQLGPGTLYDNIQRLLAAKLVREVKPEAGQPDSRRRYYRLTSLGRKVLAAETARLDDVLRVARQRLQQPTPRRA
jgi:DNA-binding PadR family transcriptional regulator